MNGVGWSSAESEAAARRAAPRGDGTRQTSAANESSVSLLSFHSM